MTRIAEFKKRTKTEAFNRSRGVCEAVGAVYGLPEGQRCGRSLKLGVRYDHFNPEGMSHDASLENCRAVCPPCHRYKTEEVDVPQIAKADAQREKLVTGVRRKRPWAKRPMTRREE